MCKLFIAYLKEAIFSAICNGVGDIHRASCHRMVTKVGLGLHHYILVIS